MSFLNLMLAIFSIIITIIFGISGIRYALRAKYKAEISFFEEDCIPLFKSIEKNLDNIKILYKKRPISPSLILLKGCLFNTGSIDIDRSSIHQALSAGLPKNYLWIYAKIMESSPNVNANLQIKGNKVEFYWDLFKRGEFIRFNALINAPAVGSEKSESKIIKNIFDGISFSHRITNLEKTIKQRLPRSLSSSERKLNTYIMLIGSLIWMAFLLWGVLNKVTVIRFSVIDEKGNTHLVSLAPRERDKIVMNGLEDNFKLKIASSEINKFKYVPVLKQIKKSILLYVIASFFIIIIIFAMPGYIQDLRNIRKRKKIDHILCAK